MREIDRYVIAERQAEQLLERLGIDTLPVDPIAIARRHGIAVRAKDSKSPGVSGCLLKVGDQFGILYATHIQNDGFIRFSIGHEIGHYFLPGHPEYLFPHGDGYHESQGGFVSSNPYELEADHFAAGLLMPEKLFLRELYQASEGFTAIESLAETFKTSITATAIRFATVSEEPVAIVVSSGNRIDYCFMSDALKSIKEMRWISKGEIVPQGTATHRFNSNSINVSSANRIESWTTLDFWFGGAPEIEMKEDVVGLGEYNKTLTVLFSSDCISEGSQEEEHEGGLEELDGILPWPSKKRRR